LVEIYADVGPCAEAPSRELIKGAAIPGTTNGYVYTGRVASSRSTDGYTIRIVPRHPQVRVPAEAAMILWEK
jgi:hypothetical protein